jgi:hypothetical protein
MASASITATQANDQFNDFIAAPDLPLVIFHDHFIGQPGGVAIFFAETAQERAALAETTALAGWQVEIRPLIFSRNPAAFDEQIAYTLHTYRHKNWEELQREQRPSYGNPIQEAETALEEEIEA